MLLWADIDNAPHVLVLRPIIAWLRKGGHEVEITARDYGQTLPLLDLFGMSYTVVGKHAGKRIYRKILSFVTRSISLWLFARKKHFAAVFCHGTRAVFIPSKLLGIPLVVMADYEHTALPGYMRSWPRMVLIPEIIPSAVFQGRRTNVKEFRKYPGLKEELYVYDCEPDANVFQRMGIDLEKPLVLIRPPASMAHYHVKEGDKLFLTVMEYFRTRPDLQVILLPRTNVQATELRFYLQKHVSPNIKIPTEVSHGPNLIYHSDLVISGGGTMNREAACMHIPVFTIFRGTLGAVDKHLIEQGRLRMLRDIGILENWSFQKAPKPELKAKRAIRENLVEFIGKSILSATQPPGNNKTRKK